MNQLSTENIPFIDVAAQRRRLVPLTAAPSMS
jgi:hypothetical protein